MTDPSPMVKVNGLPFLLAISIVSRQQLESGLDQLTIEDFAVFGGLSNVPHANLVTLLCSTP